MRAFDENHFGRSFDPEHVVCLSYQQFDDYYVLKNEFSLFHFGEHRHEPGQTYTFLLEVRPEVGEPDPAEWMPHFEARCLEVITGLELDEMPAAYLASSVPPVRDLQAFEERLLRQYHRLSPELADIDLIGRGLSVSLFSKVTPVC